MAVANQKHVKTRKEDAGTHCSCSLLGLQRAMQSLKGETFKMWCYLAKNVDSYSFDLSCVDAIRWGIGSKSSYTNAVKELIKKGYLVQVSNNNYLFVEYPKQIQK